MKSLASLVMFAAVGLAAAAAYFGALYLFEKLWLWDYRLAASASYVISAAVHFGLNRAVTFRASHSGKISGQLLRYLVLLLTNYIINIACVVACVEWLGWTTAQGVALSMIFTLASGYLMARLWVFASDNRGRKHTEDPPHA